MSPPLYIINFTEFDHVMKYIDLRILIYLPTKKFKPV